MASRHRTRIRLSPPPPFTALAITIAALLVFPALVLGWNATGHRTVAEVAWDHMTPHTRARAVALLMHGPAAADFATLRPTTGTEEERDRALFLNAATWPDLIRDRNRPGHVYSRPSWHYADFYWDVVDGRPHNIPNTGPDSINAGERITTFRNELADAAAPDTTRALALVWLVHLVGDIHQPLHASSRVTPRDTLPRGDLGGNTFSLDDHHELHAYWDDILDIAIARTPGEDSIAYVTRLGGLIQAAYPRSALANAAAATDVAEWEGQGLYLSQTVVYDGVVRGQAPSPEYEARALKTAERQIALAGYRLADLLNTTLQ